MAWYDVFTDVKGTIYGLGNSFKDMWQVDQADVNRGLERAQGTSDRLGQRVDGMDQEKDSLGRHLRGRSPWASAPQVGADPYSRNWNGLLTQLQRQADGTGPSLAAQQYQNATNDNIAAQAALARSGNTGAGAAARQAALGAGQAQQGLAAGVAEARTREQMAAQQQLQGAITGAGGAAFQRDALNAQLTSQANQANQAAYLDMLSKQLGISVEQIRALASQGQLDLGIGQLALGKNSMPTGMDKWMNAIGTALPLAAGGG